MVSPSDTVSIKPPILASGQSLAGDVNQLLISHRAITPPLGVTGADNVKQLVKRMLLLIYTVSGHGDI
jgi:hypothetical protein